MTDHPAVGENPLPIDLGINWEPNVPGPVLLMDETDAFLMVNLAEPIDGQVTVTCRA